MTQQPFDDHALGQKILVRAISCILLLDIAGFAVFIAMSLATSLDAVESLAITSIFCFFLYKRYRWARWICIVGLGLTLLPLITFSVFSFKTNRLNEGIIAVIFALLVVYPSYLLLFDQRIKPLFYDRL